MHEAKVRKAVILIVEDETIVALDMRLRLEKLEYVVCAVAGSAQAAIEKNRECQPDLILMDIKLKGDQDGIEAAIHIQAESGTPVIFVTAFTDDATIARVREASPFGYIVKPFHEREVSIAIELALAKHAYQKSLEQAKQLAEESNRAKSSFLSNISHELKTPLNSIIGFVDLAFQLAEGDDLREYLLFAGRGARRLEASINAILDYTKLENNALAPISSEFYIEDLLIRVWEPYAPDAYAKGLAISLYIDPALPESMSGDANKIATILKNLVENAVKFTTSGHVRLLAELEQQSNKKRMHIVVSDTGTGISKTKLQNLFDPFSQGDASYTRLFEGLGLGLCLVKKLTDLMAIELNIDAQDSNGTTVHLYLDLPQASTPAYQLSNPDHARLSVGGYGLVPVIAEDLGRTVNMLGAKYINLSEQEYTPTELDLLYIELAAWSRAPNEVKEALFESVHCISDRLIILGSPTDPYCYEKRSESYFRRPFPIQLSLVYDDIVKCSHFNPDSDTISHSGIAQACDPAVHTANAAALYEAEPGKLSRSGSAYTALTREALLEAFADEQMKLHLLGLWTDLRIAFDAQDFSIIERTTKRYYDEFSRDDAKACARLTLSLLMDIRKGPGPWIHDMQNMLHKEIAQLIDTLKIRQGGFI
ncbi:MAG: response regulator [Spirochaetes bacterium]|nr:response regulator [Spirochaetota bacterium]